MKKIVNKKNNTKKEIKKTVKKTPKKEVKKYVIPEIIFFALACVFLIFAIWNFIYARSYIKGNGPTLVGGAMDLIIFIVDVCILFGNAGIAIVFATYHIKNKVATRLDYIFGIISSALILVDVLLLILVFTI